MSSQPKELGFLPVHGGHAVEQAIVAVRFDPELVESQLADLRNAMGSLVELPKRGILRGLTVAIGPSAVAQRPGQGEAELGVVFTRHNSSGELEAELQLERGAMTYRITKYPGWANLLGFFRNVVLERALPIYAKGSRPTSFFLSYIDKFIADSLDNSSVFDILRANSPYLCSYLYELNDYWHCHTGAFVRTDAHLKRLVNVNVDYRPERTDDEQRRAVVLSVALTDIPRVSPEPPTIDTIASLLDSMHAEAKRLVGEVINDDMAQRLALHG